LSKTALVVTVGGSHEPIVAAIESVRPDFVLFVCSSDDPVTDNKGSYTQIQGEGKIIKAHLNDEKPTLKNIPSQLELDQDAYRVVLVDSDDIDQAYSIISDELQQMVDEYDTVISDYTGGTKSMTSSLVLASVDNEQVKVQVVAGARGNLRRIDSTFQSVQAMHVGRTRFKNDFDTALGYWRHHNYATSLQALERLKANNKEDLARLNLAVVACKAFVAWDVFDHTKAQELLTHIAKRLSTGHKVYLQQLGLICSDSKITMPNRIFDLWLNAQRCALRCRYDDATSRVYRLLEWSSQWLLQHYLQVNTDDVPKDLIPAEVNIAFNERTQKYMAALVPAWELAGSTCGDASAEFWQKNKVKLLDLLEVRNNSILAHGYKPITENDWKKMESFVESRLLPFISTEFEAIGVKKVPDQLPTEWEIS